MSYIHKALHNVIPCQTNMFLCFYLDDEVDESSTQELFEDKLKDLIDATTEKRYLNN